MRLPWAAGLARHTTGARSLQTRLMVMVLGAVCVVWALAVLATWYDTEHEVGELLDAHLSHAAALMLSQPLDALAHTELHETPTLHEDQRRVMIQVWHDQMLVLRSASAPVQPLLALDRRGFAQIKLGNTGWRVFSAQGHGAQVVVQVAEQDKSRRDVVLSNLRSVVYPMCLALPLLVLGVWAALRQALRPLLDLKHQVASRNPEAAEPLVGTGVPTEVQPLVDALNRLFERMAWLIESERRFTADAAHELRTPLAGIRMQAQVAQGADDADERNQALAATLQGCDRAARLVDQLLQLARLENQADVTNHRAHVPTWVRTLTADLAPVAARRGQQVQVNCDEAPHADLPATAWCPVPEGLLGILLRNLLDNALRYSPDGATVRVDCGQWPDGRSYLCVDDSGPGMQPDDIRRLGERFFRVVGTHQPGSGLGWSIVMRIARLYGLSVEAARSPTLGGLQVTVSWAAGE